MEVYNWKGLNVLYDIIDLGWEGDPSVPNGVNYLGKGAEIVSISSPDGTDISDYFTDGCIEILEEEIWDKESASIDYGEEFEGEEE